MNTAARIDPAAVLTAAERLAIAGWPVFPCVPGEKRPLTSHGMLDATTDLERIREWWRRTPTANLAIPTGLATVDVLDVDVRPAGSGFAAFNDLKRAGLLAGYSRVISTPSGGMHVYFTGTDQPSSRLPDHHLDLKAAGGYVLTPPSVVDGGRYVVVRRAPGPHQRLDWSAIRELLVPRATDFQQGMAANLRQGPPRQWPGAARTDGGIDVLAAWVATLPEGRRNAGTFWAACRAAEQGCADLTLIVAGAIRAGLPEPEARRTVESALRRIVQSGPSTPATGPAAATCQHVRGSRVAHPGRRTAP
jgi:Bifunctional DNA primase/polymerase, N-terminal